MSLRVVLRWVAFGAPYSWFSFATRFAAGHVVGPEFFKHFAKRVHATYEGGGPDAGLMQSLDTLRWQGFDPNKVHALIREFYEHTSRFDMAIEIQWNPIIKPFGALYFELVAREMKQLEVPLDDEGFRGLDNWVDVIDLESDGEPDYRCWIRVLRNSRTPVYVGAYKTYQSEMDGEPRGYVSVAFPVPGGTITTVLTPLNLEGDGMMLTSRAPDSTENGVYWLIPGKRDFSLLPAFGLSERFQLRPAANGTKVDVFHDCFWLGIKAFRMHYHITRMRQRTRESVRGFLEGFGKEP